MLIEFFIQPRFLVRFIRVVIVVFKTITLAKIHFSVGGAKSVGAKCGANQRGAADKDGINTSSDKPRTIVYVSDPRGDGQTRGLSLHEGANQRGWRTANHPSGSVPTRGANQCEYRADGKSPLGVCHYVRAFRPRPTTTGTTTDRKHTLIFIVPLSHANTQG